MTDDTNETAESPETNSSPSPHDRSGLQPLTDDSAPNGTVLLSDGGENESGESDDEEDEATAAGGVSDQSAQTERDAGGEGTSLVYLDLDGLFVDLLGVEIDLNEVELDVSAVPGSGNLLGNLLSEVVGLLDDGPMGLLEDLVEGLLDRLLPEEGLSGLRPEIEVPSASEVVYGGINAVLDAVLDALGAETDDEAEDEADDERSGETSSTTPDLDPNEHTIAELADELGDIEDPEELRAIHEAEADGDDRTGAEEAIEERLEEVSDDSDGDAAGNDDSGNGSANDESESENEDGE